MTDIITNVEIKETENSVKMVPLNANPNADRRAGHHSAAGSCP